MALASYYSAAAGFVDDFETLYGSTPQMFAAQAYDSTGICMKAIEEAFKVKGGEIPTRTEVANAIRTLQDYQGITGVYIMPTVTNCGFPLKKKSVICDRAGYNFDKNDDPNQAQYFVFQVVSTDLHDWGQNKLMTSFEVAPPK